jgi:hypothetical protein
MRSIQEFETRLEATWKELENTDIEIAKHGENSPVATQLRRLQDAYVDLIHELEGNIAYERKRAICNDPLALLKEKTFEAEMEMVAAERRLGAYEEGSFTQRWNRWKALEARWWSAINALLKHRSACPYCVASR